MTHLDHQPLSSLTGTDAVAGCWKLANGRALTLRPRAAGVLRIAHGRVWITFDHADQDDGVRGGDHFLGAGEALHLLPGQALVMESWDGADQGAAYFSWDPVTAAASIAVVDTPRRVLAAGSPWHAGVAQPLRDLRLALGLATTASGHLVTGLAGAAGAALLVLMPRFATDFVADRARGALAARAFNAQSSESRAHCAIS